MHGVLRQAALVGEDEQDADRETGEDGEDGEDGDQGGPVQVT
ncbi:hypothetical protein [Streptomyces sp. TRM68367]|nr:hypothetical protein [Streptomyces sp. TRM68367]